MAILRVDKSNNYTVIHNAVFFDNNISFKAKGLLCQMLSLPDGWSFSIEGLTRLATDGRDSVASTLKELEEAGYFRREQSRSDGKFRGIEYIVTEKPFTEKPYTGKSITENPTQLNTNKSNTKKSNTNLHTHKELRPTLEDIRSYISEKNLNVDAEKFYDYFEAGEWKDSKGEPVRNWKQKLITWSKSNGSNTGSGGRKPHSLYGEKGSRRQDNERVATGFIPMADSFSGE